MTKATTTAAATNKTAAKKTTKAQPAKKVESKVTAGKVKPVTRVKKEPAVKPAKNVAKPLPAKKTDDKIAASIKASAAKVTQAKEAAGKKAVKAKPVKAVVGVAKNITVDQLINFAKSEKTLNQAGKFVQVVQFESNRKNFTAKLSAPVKINGEVVNSIKLNTSDILLLDAEAAKVFRQIDVANVTLKLKRI